MILQEILHWLHEKWMFIKDAAIGSMVYFVYGQFFQRKNFLKGLVAFFIGTVVAVYFTPQVHVWFDSINENLISFVAGLFGMRIAEFLLNKDFNEIFDTYQKLKSLNIKK